MNKDTIFTIGRQFGSGGREIGQALAKRLGIRYYDVELITEAAKISGLLEETVKRYDERVPDNKGHPYWFTPFQMHFEPMGQQIFGAQFAAVEKVASEGGCVIVGRCADYVLRNRPHVVSVFIHAAQQAREERIARRHPDEAAKAEQLMQRTDKARAWYYSFYTGKTWGAAESYDLCLRSDTLGVDRCVDLIIAYAEAAEKGE
jgi:cytidylate kinase